jgi:hypothetical protein
MPRTRDIIVCVETDIERSNIIGRNGDFPICAAEIRSVAGFARISGIGRRGRAIHGGILLTAEAMDRLAHQWLRERVRR